MSDPYRGASPRPPTQAEAEGNAKPWELKTWASERACPVCAIPLFAAAKDGYRIDACGKCGGSWISLGDLRKMIDTSNKTPIELARMADSVASTASPPTPEARTCPECKAPLAVDNLAGVDIDVCGDHGTWFDARELERVSIVLLKEYGLARRITDAEAERKRLAAENEHWYSVNPANVAYGVAALGLALVGAAVHVPPQFDAFGREVEIDVLGNKVLKRPTNL